MAWAMRGATESCQTTRGTRQRLELEATPPDKHKHCSEDPSACPSSRSVRSRHEAAPGPITYRHDLLVLLVVLLEGDGVEDHHLGELGRRDALVGRAREQPVRSESVHAPGCGREGRGGRGASASGKFTWRYGFLKAGTALSAEHQVSADRPQGPTGPPPLKPPRASP
jgi:hypothetical protein